MALYLISYDISEKDAFEYDGLWAKLKELGAARILYSEWAVEGDTANAGLIYSHVAPTVQEKDRLLVQEITKDAAWDKLLIKDSDFKQFLSVARR